MTRRSEIKGVAQGLIDSFNSRNNDVDGYWGIGKLYKFAKSKETDTLRIDLLRKEIVPSSKEFNNTIETYRLMLESLLKSNGIPFNWLHSVNIIIEFNQEPQPKYHFLRSALGDPYICTCEIVDDNGRLRKAIAGNNCWPHDPQRERRSSRCK
ncbi:MAG: hypothetical protein AAFX95_19290 [Cyanobacteria bacterium J06639_16]